MLFTIVLYCDNLVSIINYKHAVTDTISVISLIICCIAYILYTF